MSGVSTQTGLPPRDLSGVRVFVLRGSEWGESVADRVTSRGGEPRVVPLLEIQIAESEQLQNELKAWARGEYDWLLLTSMNTVRAVEEAQVRSAIHAAAERTIGADRTSRVAAVGPTTARAAAQIGLDVSLLPEHDFATEGLLDAIRDEVGSQPSRFLFPVSNLTDERMQRALAAAGHEVVRVTAYETREIEAPADLFQRLAEHRPTVVLITSGSAARALHRQLPHLPETISIAAIGRSTARTLSELGIDVDVVAEQQTIDGLLDAIATHLIITSQQEKKS